MEYTWFVVACQRIAGENHTNALTLHCPQAYLSGRVQSIGSCQACAVFSFIARHYDIICTKTTGERTMQISEPAEYAILGLLEDQPMHGYELFQRFQSEVLGQIVHIEMSQLYAFLKKLERLVLIESELEPQGARPPRKVYQPTHDRRALLRQWLTTPVERPRDIRILFLIKLYFVQRQLPEQLSTLIEQEVAACKRFLGSLEALRHGPVSIRDQAIFDQVILNSRIYQTRALLDWLHELQAEFAQTQ
jgi:PadR family transcriptional regulator, regulatory protein AphA